MNSPYRVDQTDKQILAYLVKDARMSYSEIARQCGVSSAAIHQRVKKMESCGIITGSRLLVKPSTLGLNVCAFISIALSENNKYSEVIAALKKVPEIVECHFITGRASLFTKVYCFNNDHLLEVILNTIQRIPYVQSTDTMISLDEAFERQVWVMEYQYTGFKTEDSE